jgi:hypothetical protein
MLASRSTVWRRPCEARDGTGLPVQPGNDEQPQLYFSHHFKVGNAYEFAKEVRRGLGLTSVKIG